jgi:hypothetical protein
MWSGAAMKNGASERIANPAKTVVELRGIAGKLCSPAQRSCAANPWPSDCQGGRRFPETPKKVAVLGTYGSPRTCPFVSFRAERPRVAPLSFVGEALKPLGKGVAIWGRKSPTAL